MSLLKRVLISWAAVHLVASTLAWACTCIFQSTEEQFEENDMVFLGLALESASPRGCHFVYVSEQVTTTFEVLEAFKGTEEGDLVELSHHTSGASCGESFLPNSEHVLFTDGANWSICAGPSEPTAELLAELRALAEEGN